MLYATVRQRKIHVKNPVTVIQNGIGVDQVVLDMDDEWKEMTSIVCVFTNGEVAKEVLHTFGQPIQVPWECLAETGLLSISCTGYVGSTKVMTTMMPDSFWNVVQNGPATGDTPMEPTATLYEQVLAAAGAANTAATQATEIAEQLEEDRENGVFNGEDGKTPEVTIGTVVTGTSGSEAQVTRTGIGADVTLNFVLPRGEQGATGAPGKKGDKGDRGEPGEPGAKGDKGDKGEPGINGTPGAKGDKGDKGEPGEKGDKGDTGAGFRVLGYYASAEALEAAVTSPAIGDAYGVGSAAPYDIYIYSPTGWVNNGQLQGAKGDPGQKGEKGDPGEPGAKGEKGDKGDRGATGADGAPGAKGDKGDKGETGATGATGAKGEKGDTGAGVQSMTYNSSTNKWTVTLTDGSTLTVDGPTIPDVSAYMPKSGGTFTGAVKTATADTGSYYVRNIKFSTTAETPTAEGDICFKLE